MLTDEQRSLVEQNHNLIYGYCYKHNLDIEENYDLLAIALCKAAEKFNPDNGTFGTLAYQYMTNALRQQRYLSKMQKRSCQTAAFSLDELLADDAKDSFSNLIGCDTDFTGPEVKEIISKFTPQQKFILHNWILKTPRPLIAKAIHRSPELLSLERAKMKKTVLDYENKAVSA